MKRSHVCCAVAELWFIFLSVLGVSVANPVLTFNEARLVGRSRTRWVIQLGASAPSLYAPYERLLAFTFLDATVLSLVSCQSPPLFGGEQEHAVANTWGMRVFLAMPGV